MRRSARFAEISAHSALSAHKLHTFPQDSGQLMGIGVLTGIDPTFPLDNASSFERFPQPSIGLFSIYLDSCALVTGVPEERQEFSEDLFSGDIGRRAGDRSNRDAWAWAASSDCSRRSGRKCRRKPARSIAFGPAVKGIVMLAGSVGWELCQFFRRHIGHDLRDRLRDRLLGPAFARAAIFL